MTAADLDNLDPGIRNVVTLLRAHGFDTFDSGDGVTKLAPDADVCECGAEDFPHVRMRVPPLRIVLEAGKLENILLGAGIALARNGDDGPVIHALWSTHDPELAVLELVGVTDAMLPGGA